MWTLFDMDKTLQRVLVKADGVEKHGNLAAGSLLAILNPDVFQGEVCVNVHHKIKWYTAVLRMFQGKVCVNLIKPCSKARCVSM